MIEDIDPTLVKQIENSFPFLGFLENMFNVISAAFVYLAFNVLYDVTLDSKNRPKIYYKGTIMFLLIFTFSYVFFLYTSEKSHITNIFRLVCGIYNGLAMGLLFGRFISMEYFFKDLDFNNKKFSKNFYYIGTIFILPLYVIAQPLYGMFNLVGFLDNPLLFKSLVFLICFLGKSFFLLLFYNYINFKWFHIYLHLTLANHAIPKNIANDFPEIKDLP